MARVVLSLAASAVAEDVFAETTLGRLVGEGYELFQVFRGIRYAEPPKRFEVAEPKQPWQGDVAAKEFGAACFIDTKVDSMSEDCLFANVWSPREAADLPVVAFIHGGGFMIGSGADPKLWGDLFVSEVDPVVYVNFNYRMGILGFFSGPEGANFGFQDQQLALRWVSENIAAFGGAKQKVMLMGQSAGAMSVQAHLVAPGSAGLFQRAFLASTVGLHYRTVEENQPFVDSAAKAAGCLWGNRTACMLKHSPEFLDAAAVASGYLFHLHSSCDNCDNILPWLPVVDGTVIPRPPLEMIESGDHVDVPVVFSSVRNESWAFIPGILQGITNWEHGYNLAMQVMFRDSAEAVKSHYAQHAESAAMNFTSKLGLAVSDSLFTCYSRYLAKRWEDSGSVAHLSNFMHRPSGQADPGNAGLDPGCERGATCHAADLNWIFPETAEMQSRCKSLFTQEETALARRYSAAIRAFAHGDSTSWVRYSDDRSTLWHTDSVEVVSQYHVDHCNFLEDLGYPVGPWAVSKPELLV